MKRHIKTGLIVSICSVLIVFMITTVTLAATALEKYLGNCLVTESVHYGKVMGDNVPVMSFPCTKAANSNSQQIGTLKTGDRVKSLEIITNPESTNRNWWKVTYDTGSSSVMGYIPAYLSGDSGDVTLKSSILDDCTNYVSHVSLKAVKASRINTLPCSVSTDSNSESLVSYAVGDTLTAIGLVKNQWGNLWYKVNCTVNGASKTGYVLAENFTSTPLYNVSISGVKGPSGNLTMGKSLTLEGKITSSVLPLNKVGAFVYSGTATSGTAETGKYTSTTAKTYSIKGSAVDTNCKIGSLKAGEHTYVIKVNILNYYATSGTSVANGEKTIILHKKTFMEVNPEETLYSVKYDANGGTGAPQEQYKVGSNALTLRTETPSRASVVSETYTVSFNANGGSVSPASKDVTVTTTYSFDSWNTAVDGSGTRYLPGGSYTTKANVTLYAQWNSGSTKTYITLPSATRTGYTFLGWATSASATSANYQAGSSYTTSTNRTLYAVWKAAPKVTKQPDSLTVANGGNAVFSVTASGTGLSYQWQYSSDNGKTWANSTMTGYNTASMQVPVVAGRNGYLYRCIVKNSAGSVTSSSAKLTVSGVKPVIRDQTNALTSSPNLTLTFKVAAAGVNLSYQWQVSFDNGKNWYDTTLSGCKTAALKVSATSERNGYLYRCKVSNSYGTVISSPAKLTVSGVKPVIRDQTNAITSSPNVTVTFKVVAAGTGLSYKWQYSNDGGKTWHDSTMTGYNTAAMKVPVIAGRNGYLYHCIVKNSYGSVTSSPAKLTVR